MALFSRRTTMVVAGCALVLPLAAGTANAAFDFGADRTDPVDDAEATVSGSFSSTDAAGSATSPVGKGTADAGVDEARVRACAAKQRPCAALRVESFPTVQNRPAVKIETIDADALARASKDGASVSASATVRREDVDVTVEASPDGGSLEAETPFGDGSGELDLDGSIAAGAPVDRR